MNPLTWSAAFLHTINDAMRLTADDAFTRLVKRGWYKESEGERRNFINQLGNYNPRLQHKLVILARDLGLGPFATAGTRYYTEGLKALTLSPHAAPTSRGADLAIRAERLARISGMVGLAFLANQILSGRPDGDDSTPLGAIRLHTDANGKTYYFDLTNSFSGLKRGMRETGLLALTEGQARPAMRGETAEPVAKSIDKGTSQAMESILHPFFGPAAQFSYTAATGKDALGRDIAKKAGYAESQKLENVKAAVEHANPTVATLFGFGDKDEKTKGERALELARPFIGSAAARQPQDVQNYYDALHATEEAHKLKSQEAAKKGLRTKEPPEMAPLRKVEKEMHELRLKANRPDATEEDRRQIHERQSQLARDAMTKWKALQSP